MQSIEPVGSNSAYPSEAKPVSEALSQKAYKATKAAAIASRARFRPNSWLSNKDANLLLRKRAQREAKQGNFAAAVQIFNRLTVYEPENADNFANRGLMHYNLKHYKQAFQDYNQAITLKPDLDRALSNRANLHASQHNWAEAIADYDQAIDLNPLNIRARLNQALTLREMGDYEEALVCLDIALFFRPESATLYAERGRTYQLEGQWNCAIADYTTARKLARLSTGLDLSAPGRVNDRVVRWMSSLY